ncbi:hypothetical protein PF003_g7413 [Phytophthora fragariae]|nr:hypothetical protein PF003_g7413 [Phytophthora fragariae]
MGQTGLERVWLLAQSQTPLASDGHPTGLPIDDRDSTTPCWCNDTGQAIEPH